MFGVVLHPQPVGRRHAVAELSVRGVQARYIGTGHVLIDTGVDMQQFPQTQVTEGVASSIISLREGFKVVVKYRLREYLQVLSDFVPIERHRTEQLSGKSKSDQPKKMTWLTKSLLFTIGSAAYFYKVIRVGKCTFTINGDGVIRISKGGTLNADWSEVVEVLKLSEAYLIKKVNGAMPLPFRCMTNEECAEFERFAGSKLTSSKTNEA